MAGIAGGGCVLDVMLESFDIYSNNKDKYKGVSVCLLILSRALSGGYCNLGVFQVCCAPLSLSGLDPLAWSCSCRACARWLCRAVLPPTSVPSSRANRGGC